MLWAALRFATLMHAADYNAMTSLYEPHGAAFEGAVVPIVRLIDGLVRQVSVFEPTGRAAPLSALWHEPWELPSGLGFREQAITILKHVLELEPEEKVAEEARAELGKLSP